MNIVMNFGKVCHSKVRDKTYKSGANDVLCLKNIFNF